MTEGDRLCPYCGKPMEYIGYGTAFNLSEWLCKICKIMVKIRELK